MITQANATVGKARERAESRNEAGMAEPKIAKRGMILMVLVFQDLIIQDTPIPVRS